MVREHRALERLGGELRLAAVRRDPSTARMRSIELARQFPDIVRRAHSELGQFLDERPESPAAEVLQAQVRTGRDLTAAIVSLATSWGSAVTISSDLDGFRAEVEHLVVKLALWIHGEERKLFPLVDALCGVGSFREAMPDEPTTRINRADLLRAGIR